MQKEQEQLLSLLARAMFGSGAAEPAPLTDAVLAEAGQQAVLSLISDDYQGLANNIRVDAAHAALTELMRGIPFVTFKGYASASYYPDPIRRAMGDVDFYVPQDYRETALSRLLEAGYRPAGDKNLRHECYERERIDFELHSELQGVPNGKGGIKTDSGRAEAAVRRYLSDLVETAVTVPSGQGDIVIPDAFHHGLIMLLHVAGHIMNSGGVGLRHLCDWAVYVARVDLAPWQSRYEEMGLWTFARQLTALCIRYLGLREMPWVGTQDGAFLAELMDDFLTAGNFGRKDYRRALSAELTQERGTADSLIAMTKHRYPFCARRPILLPLGFFAYGCRYVWRRLSGKRRWLGPDTLQLGRRRRELYRQFHLFE